MTHYYEECPDNPDGKTPWGTKETNCPWCLHERILFYEVEYRDDPEYAISRLRSYA